MRIAQALLLASVLALLGADPGKTPAPAAAEDKVGPLVTQLSDDAPAVRDAAAKALAEMGVPVVEDLDRARKETKDEDLRLRLEMILKKIADQTGVTAQSLVTDREMKLPASRVTLDLKDATVEKALKEIAAQTGNRAFEASDPQMLKRRVTLSLKDVPYWEAMRKLLDAAGLYLEPDWNRGMLTDRMVWTEMSAVAGPTYLFVQSCTRSQTTNLTFRQPKDAVPGANMNQQVYINLQYMTEDRLPVLSVAAMVTSVRNAGNAELLPRRDDGRGGLDDIGYYRGRGAGSGDVNVSLNQQAAAEPGPVTISGTVNLRLALGTRAVRVEKAFGKDPAEVVSGPYTIKVKSARRDGGSVVMELDVKARGGAPVLHEGAARARFGFSLAFPPRPDAKDQAETRSWSIGSYEIRSDGSRSSGHGGEDTPFNVGWIGRRGGDADVSVGLTLTFTNVPDGDDAALVFTGPDHVEQRTYPFTIKDIPLP